MVTNREIKEYYDFSKLDYQIYNLARSNISMHFGLWEGDIRSHKEALLNENKILAGLAGITRKDCVLDVGCGYGTTAIWLAKNIGCKVIGITISNKQVKEAKEMSKKQGVEHLTDFEVMDFHSIDFPESTFDHVVAIESISHSTNKRQVLTEVFRVLKSEGKFVVADGYFAKDKSSLTQKEKRIADICFEGVHVPPLAERSEYEKWLSDVGFSNILWIDKTFSVMRISKRISNIAKLFLPISKVLGVFGIHSISTPHVKAFINQYYAWRDGLGVYGIFVAEK